MKKVAKQKKGNMKNNRNASFFYRAINLFSLSDLEEGKISFVHTGVSASRLALRVSDGQRVSTTMVFPRCNKLRSLMYMEAMKAIYILHITIVITKGRSRSVELTYPLHPDWAFFHASHDSYAVRLMYSHFLLLLLISYVLTCVSSPFCR